MPKIIQVDLIRKQNDGLYIDGYIQGRTLSFLVDTGASVTLISTGVYHQIAIDKRPPLVAVDVQMETADGKTIPCLGKGMFDLQVEGIAVKHEVWVAEITPKGILGLDFLSHNNCNLNLGKNEIHFNELPGTPYDDDDYDVECKCKVAVCQTVQIPPESETLIKAYFIDKPASPMEGVLEPTFDFLNSHNLILAKALVSTQNDKVVARVLNVTSEPICVHKGMIVANLSPVAKVVPMGNIKYCRPVRVTPPREGNDETPTDLPLPEYLQPLWDNSTIGLDERQKKELHTLLLKHIDIFAKSKQDTGLTDVVEHHIDTGDTAPIKQRARRLPIHQRQEEKQQLEDMLQRGIIVESNSPWASPVVLVRKKDGSWRYCIDYRKLNACTVKDSYPLPRIDDSLDQLSGSQWFTTLDLQSGYWQVKMSAKDQEKTAFITSQGLYEFTVLPFGLANAPAAFERLIERILRGLQYKTCLVYLDDVIVHAQEFNQAVERLDEVFSRLKAAGLKLNPKKCHLLQKQVSYLGHVVSKDGITTDPEKIQAVSNWPRPVNVSQLRSFLGMCSYYRRFIAGYANIAKPLHVLTEKNRVFIWTEEAEGAFQKVALTTSPILAYPNPDDCFILDTDASNHGIAGVLSQKQNGVERVVAYYSRTINRPERNYCVTRKELLAVVASVKHFHHYLFGRKFLIRTDHGALAWLLRFKNPEGQVARWLEVLNTYEFNIEHRPGRHHGNCDGLSRRPCTDGACEQCARIERYMGENPVHIPARLPKSERGIVSALTVKSARLVDDQMTCVVKKKCGTV